MAVFFLRLAQYRAERGEAQAATSTLTRAQVELDAARATRHRARGATFLEGSAGLHALRAAVAAAAGRHADAARAAARVVDAEHDVAQLPPDDCELLYGRAGYLHACLVARQAAGAAGVPDSVIVRTATAILDSGAAAADAAGPAFAQKWGLLFRWKGADYLGAAHGLCGIVSTLLQAEAALTNAGWRLPHNAAVRLRAATLALAAAVMPSGNLPTRVTGRDADDRLVQWCHGAPGLLLLAAHSAAAHERGSNAGVPYARIAAQLDAAADCVWCVQPPLVLTQALLSHIIIDLQAAWTSSQGRGVVPRRGRQRVRAAGALARLPQRALPAPRAVLRRLGGDAPRATAAAA